MPAFKKNDEVTYIASWDNAGTFYFVHAVVYSCGKKQMVLTDAVSGKELGRHFDPKGADWNGGTFPRMTDAEATAKAIEMGAAHAVAENARIDKAIAFYGARASQGYLNAMEKDRAKLNFAGAAVDRTGA